MTLHTCSKSTSPLSDRFTLSIRDAATYFSIGENKLRQIVKDNPEARLSITSGNRILIKRKAFENFLEESGCI